MSASDRRSAAAGVCLAIACRPRAVAAQRAVWAATAVAGPRVLPGRRVSAPTVEPALAAEFSELVGPFDDLAYYRRPQASRDSGLTALLLRRGRPLALVKVRADAGPLARERAALEALAGSIGGGVGGVTVPTVLGGRLDGPSPWLAQQVLAVRPHRPAWPEAVELAGEVSAALASWAAPAGTPARWRPAHGDLTPWNVRRAGGRTLLLDWEDCEYAPPGTDAVYFAATCAAARLGPARCRRRPRLPGDDGAEAAAWWWDHSAKRPLTDRDAPLTVAVRGCLNDWYRLSDTGA